MEVIAAVAVLAAVLALALTHAFRGRQEHTADQAGEELSVTLAVFPGRKAVVTLDAMGGRSAGTADLVNHAVRYAFTLAGIDRGELRRADGELLERRLRPALGRPTLALREPDR